MKKFLLGLCCFSVVVILTVAYFLKSYLPNEAIVVDIKGSIEEQLFQYSSAYSLSKKIGCKLYLFNTLENFNFSKGSTIRKNLLSKLYFKFISKRDNQVNNFIKELLEINIGYVNEKNFFSVRKKENKEIFIMEGDFESPIYFQDFKNEILKQLNFVNIDTKKLQPIVREISLKNNVCIYVKDINISLGYYKQAIKLAKKLLEQPKFFIFLDNKRIKNRELEEATTNAEYIKEYTHIEDLYLMSKCANNIIDQDSFSWWTGYLNQNNGLTIAPYHTYNESYFLKYKNLEEQYIKRAIDARAYPENWLLLAEEPLDISDIAKEYIHDKSKLAKILAGYIKREFNIYTGNHIQLDVCEGHGDFRPNLCIMNNKLPSHSPTVVTAYYNIKNKYQKENYLEWAQNFFQIPFNLVVYTDKENSGWIKNLRGNLPMVLIKKSIEEFENYKFLDKYQYYSEIDQERNPYTNRKLHSPKLYILWNEKVKFVNDAIKLNPYSSRFFVWCDMGTFREKEYIKNNFMSDKFMFQDKLSLIVNRDFDDENLRNGFLNDVIPGVQGNIQIGDIRAWQVYNYLYDITKNDLMNKNILAGKDQTIMSTMVIRYLELFNLIYQDPRDQGSVWWYGLLYYSDYLENSNK